MLLAHRARGSLVFSLDQASLNGAGQLIRCFLRPPTHSMRKDPIMRFWALVFLIGAASPLCGQSVNRGEPQTASAISHDIIQHLDSMGEELVSINQDLWNFAELGLQEHRSAARLTGVLKKAGFKVKQYVSDMPTAFVAEYGSGKPVIAVLAEYDALPELSQQATSVRKLVQGQSAGHGCGHCALGTGAVGAALAIKEAYDRHKLKGTLRVYGTPAEETLIGKVYMTLDGQFKDADACLHWHPGTQNRIYYSSSKAAISAKFTFSGLPAHASVSPDKGRSALDGVELMN